MNPLVELKLTLIHSKGFRRNFIAKIITLVLIATGLSLFSFPYPIVFNLLDGLIPFKVGAFSLLHPFLVSVLEIALASLFQRDLVRSLITSIGGLTLVEATTPLI